MHQDDNYVLQCNQIFFPNILIRLQSYNFLVSRSAATQFHTTIFRMFHLHANMFIHIHEDASVSCFKSESLRDKIKNHIAEASNYCFAQQEYEYNCYFSKTPVHERVSTKSPHFQLTTP
jgi:hypothetical protein